MSPLSKMENGKVQTCVRFKCLSTLHRGREGQNAHRMTFPTLVTKVVACIIYAAIYLSIARGASNIMEWKN